LSRFKLVGLKNFSWPFLGFISIWLALKNSFEPLAGFWPFFVEIRSCAGNYYPFIFTTIPIFSATYLQYSCDKCYIRPRPAFWY